MRSRWRRPTVRSRRKGASSKTQADLDAGQKAPQDLLDNLDKYLAPENKPAAASDDQWRPEPGRPSNCAGAQRARSTISDGEENARWRRDHGQDEFKKDASSRSRLRFDLLYSRNPDPASSAKIERIPGVLFYIARSVETTGPQALDGARQSRCRDVPRKKAYDRLSR